MFKIYVLPIAAFLFIAPTFIEPAAAVPLIPHGLTTEPHHPMHSPCIIEVARTTTAARTGTVAGTATAAATTVVIGTGRGRRWYGGRWWPYGVGSCWRASPVGYVWGMWLKVPFFFFKKKKKKKKKLTRRWVGKGQIMAQSGHCRRPRLSAIGVTAECAGRPARSRWWKSITMKE